MKRLIAMLTVGTLALAGCASGAGKAPVPPAPDVPIAGNLPAQDLEPGEWI